MTWSESRVRPEDMKGNCQYIIRNKQ